MSCQEVVQRVEGDRQSGAVVVCVLGQLEAMRGDFEHARELYRRALATFEELGLLIDAAGVSLHSGRVELLAGDPAAAERELRRGYEYFSRLGERYYVQFYNVSRHGVDRSTTNDGRHFNATVELFEVDYTEAV